MSKQAILVLNDDPETLHLFAAMLHRSRPQYEVLSAAGNDEAIEVLAAHNQRIALIVQDCYRRLGHCLGDDSDKVNPESGRRFYTEVLMRAYGNIPVLFVTGASEAAGDGVAVIELCGGFDWNLFMREVDRLIQSDPKQGHEP